MIKQIVSISPKVQVTPEALDGTEFIGLNTNNNGGLNKYILVPSNNSDGGVSFSKGTARWSSYDSKEEAIRSVLKDNRCTVFAMSSLEDLAQWLNT